MLWEPALRLVTSVARPLTRLVADGWLTPSTANVMEPVGVPVDGARAPSVATAAMLAVNVTGWLGCDGSGNELTIVVVVEALFTFWFNGVSESLLEKKLLSPL